MIEWEVNMANVEVAYPVSIYVFAYGYIFKRFNEKCFIYLFCPQYSRQRYLDLLHESFDINRRVFPQLVRVLTKHYEEKIPRFLDYLNTYFFSIVKYVPIFGSQRVFKLY